MAAKKKEDQTDYRPPRSRRQTNKPMNTQEQWNELVESVPYIKQKVDSGIEFSQYQIPILTLARQFTHNIYIAACAGSGKSFTIICASYCIPKGKKALFLAFNSHIVKELGGKLPSHVMCKTTHALGLKAISSTFKGKTINVQGGDFGKPWKYAHKIQGIVDELMPNKKWNEKKEGYSFIKQMVDFARNTLCDYKSKDALLEMTVRYPIDYKPEFEPLVDRVAEVIDWGIQVFRDSMTIDFTDMIWIPHILDLPMEKFDAVLVDEAQDLNALQHDLLGRVVSGDGIVIVVGDPFQAMYAFSGAAIGSLELLKERFNAVEMPLSICYRCPRSHLELARCADGNRTEWRPNAPEGTIEFLVEADLHKLVKPRDLIMCRLTAPLISACIKLIAQGVGATVLGRNIGKQLVALVEDTMKPTPDDPEPKWEDFMERFENICAGMREKLGKGIDGEYRVEMFNDKADAITACFQSPQFNSANKHSFVAGIEALFSDKANLVTLCTVHRAKGLEADRVFLLADKADRDCMPLFWQNQRPSDYEQELNIIYVALTRSKDKLFIVSSGKETSKRHMTHFRKQWRAPKPISVTELPPPKPITVQQYAAPTQTKETSQSASLVAVVKARPKALKKGARLTD
jgi:hypothetical protein